MKTHYKVSIRNYRKILINKAEQVIEVSEGNSWISSAGKSRLHMHGGNKKGK